VDGTRVPSNGKLAVPARSTAVSSMLSPPANITPITVSAFAPLLAPCLASFNRRSISPASSSRCASPAAGSSPALGTRFVAPKDTKTRPRS